MLSPVTSDMATIPRLNGVIRLLEDGRVPITAFVSPPTAENAVTLATLAYDGVVFEMEHNPYDIKRAPRLPAVHAEPAPDRRARDAGAAVTPLVRIPPNGGEMSQWLAKQVLDIGVYGVVWPHVSTVEEAYNAVAACRYPRPHGARATNPPGSAATLPRRAPATGVSRSRSTTPGRRLAARPGRRDPRRHHVRGGEGDRQPAPDPEGGPRHRRRAHRGRGPVAEPRLPPAVRAPDRRLRDDGDPAICSEHNVPCGHPHVDAQNAAAVIEAGYRFLVAAPVRSYGGLDMCRKLTGRERPSG